MRAFFMILFMLAGLGLAIGLSVLLFGGLAVASAIGFGAYFLRGFLTDKGILNRVPGLPPEEQPENITIIEGDYKKLGEEETE